MYYIDLTYIIYYGIDGYIELVSIPEVFDTLDSAEEFFKDFIELNYRPTMYDCTGCKFTFAHKLFKRRGQYWVYHSVGCDS